MSDDSFMSRDPVVRVETAIWHRVVDVDGLGLRRALPFEREVTWLRGSDADFVLVNGAGGVVSNGGSRCDVGHLLSCLGSAVEGAEGMARDNAVGTGPFAVQVLLDVYERPVLPVPRERWDTDSTPPRWRPVPRDWFRIPDPAPLDAWLADRNRKYESQPVSQHLERVPVLDRFAAWDSRHDGRRRTATLDEAIARALEGLDPAEAARIAGLVREELADLAPA